MLLQELSGCKGLPILVVSVVQLGNNCAYPAILKRLAHAASASSHEDRQAVYTLVSIKIERNKVRTRFTCLKLIVTIRRCLTFRIRL